MNFVSTKLMIWQGGKPKFDQINRGVNQSLLKLQRVNQNFHKLQGVKFFMKVQNQINF